MTEFQAALFVLAYLSVRIVVPVIILFALGTLSQRRADRAGSYAPPSIAS